MQVKGRESQVEVIVEDTVEKMVSLGVYRPEYDSTIQVYAELREQYGVLTERFEQSKYKIQTKSAQGGMKKAPIVATLEALRKDILSYSDRLCLNPKAFDSMSVKGPPPASKLEIALQEIENG
ncbi:P27 family phage terminase small subunit [Phocea massiliensis]|uniref:P27 family phage terminase small subunit n=1 Tax=Merdimmobilis hominis TaxID=2897707 RepID=UPI001E529E3D|nr:P27 family phage terminase small subunit [Merdimmobilis hominis]MCD4835664.1 P27 family phage terminase small subunit [Merdimmobilis hominis]